MLYTNYTVSSRPLKIGFLVEYGDYSNLQKALHISSALWGGMYSPIIPVYKRLPSKYKKIVGYKSNKDHAITRGYIDAYDPDYILNLTTFPSADFGVSEWRTIKETDIFEKSVRSRRGGFGQLNYGIGLFEVLDYFQKEEFKYVRSVPLDVVDIKLGKRNQLFLACAFGTYSDKARDVFMKRYEKTINIKPYKVKITNFLEAWENAPTTLNEVCNSYFDVFDNNRTTDSYIFLLDINSWQDLVDYMSLKSAGLKVLPIPIRQCKSEQAIELSKRFIKENYRKYNDNNVYYQTSILKSRDCDKKTHEDFANSIHVDPPEKGQIMASRQDWFPRVWESFGRHSDDASVVRLEHSEESHDISGTSEANLPQAIPKLLQDIDLWWKPKFANDISVRVYGEEDFIATVFPAEIKRPDIVLGRPDPDAFRFSKNGITYTGDYKNSKISFHLPSAEKVYKAWLEDNGIKAEISNPGKLAQQFVKKLGVDHIDLLAFEDFAVLIQKLTGAKGKVSSVKAKAIKSAINKFTKDTIWFDGEGFFKWVIHKGIFELGADITCENCGSKSWHSLKEIDSELTCVVCYEKIHVGKSDPEKDITWAYRPMGPFAVPDLASGAYTVVLALHFFREILHQKITPRYSFVSNDGTYEADFGALVAPSWRDGNGIMQIVGECKSFGGNGKPQFEKKDIIKLEALANKSNNSVIVFATLARKLHPKDKKMIKAFATRLRESSRRKNNPPVVMVLTGNELFTHKDLKDSWSKLTAKHKSFVGNSGWYSTQEMSDMTLQLYLDMESMTKYYERKYNIAKKPELKKESKS